MRMLALASFGVFMFSDALADQPDPTQYMETTRPGKSEFVTSITRITACTISLVHDPRSTTPQATIVQSSESYRLDKAALDFAMNLKFSAQQVTDIKTFDDGQPTFAFTLDWKLYAPGDPCMRALPPCTDKAQLGGAALGAFRLQVVFFRWTLASRQLASLPL
jgi:hypothetical protein